MFIYILHVAITLAVVVPLFCKEFSVCKQSFTTNLDPIDIKEQCAGETLFIEESGPEQPGEKGEQGEKGNKGESGPANRTEIEQILDESFQNQSKTIKEMQLKLENFEKERNSSLGNDSSVQCLCITNKTLGFETTVQQFRESLAKLSSTVTLMANNFLNVNFYLSNCPAGISNGNIPNSAITFSSNSQDAGDIRGMGVGWMAATNDSEQWVQINFGQPLEISSVTTQGALNNPYWITSYIIMYGNSTDNFKAVKDVDDITTEFVGNINQNIHALRRFPKPAAGRYFRIIPKSWHTNIALRLEYFTC